MNDKMPPLPEPVGFRPDAAFTLSQLQADRLAVWNAAIEAAAEKCEQVGPKDGPLKLVGDGFASAIRLLEETN